MGLLARSQDYENGAEQLGAPSKDRKVSTTPEQSSDKLKILLLSDAFLPRGGGSREYYYNIYRELARSCNTQVTVLTKKVSGWEQFDRVSMSDNFRIRRRFKPLSSWKYWELPKGIGPFFQAMFAVLLTRPHVIHAGDLYPQGVIASLLKVLFRVPYVIYCHGEEITQTDHFRFQPRIRNRIYRLADVIIANSEFATTELVRIGACKDRIQKITPGVEVTRFQPGPANPELIAKYRLAGKTVILTVARLIPRKGHLVALEALARICQEFPEAHYLIAGTGPEEPRIRKQVELLELGDRVTLAGFVPSEGLPELYNLADIMLLANRQETDGDIEGFGIVFLEANASGKPVVGGRSGGAIEAIVDGKTGLLVNSDEAEEVAAALRRLLADASFRRALGDAGRKRSIEEFQWDTRAKTLDVVNRKLVRRSRGVISDAEVHNSVGTNGVTTDTCKIR
jgi:phosphatidylinositol alpha-1,6-mannosyltransferase